MLLQCKLFSLLDKEEPVRTLEVLVATKDIYPSGVEMPAKQQIRGWFWVDDTQTYKTQAMPGWKLQVEATAYSWFLTQKQSQRCSIKGDMSLLLLPKYLLGTVTEQVLRVKNSCLLILT